MVLLFYALAKSAISIISKEKRNVIGKILIKILIFLKNITLGIL